MCVYREEAKYNTFNRVYSNVFYNNIGGGIETGINSPPNYNFQDNVFKNNILYKNDSMLEGWNDDLPGGTQITHRRMVGFVFTNNNILGDIPEEDDIIFTHTTPSLISLVEAETRYPSLYVNNKEVVPGFIDENNHNFRLQSTSPMIDNGAFLTKAVGAGSGVTLPVEDARYFFDGFDMTDENGLSIQGDLIQLEGDTKTARVIDIDYTNNTLTLDQPLSWADGQGVSLAYNGKAPDIGAYEYTPQIVHPEVLVTLNTPKFIALGGTDSLGRDSMASSLANDLTYEILTSPQHGTLSGNLAGVKTAVLTYMPTKDYQGPDSFTYRVKDSAWASQIYTIHLKVAPWTLPIGIPDPGFGINETYRMYDNPAARNPSLTYTQNLEGGYYTHYIDSSSPNATDDIIYINSQPVSRNPYGSLSKPRVTIPLDLPAGSVVEVHSTIANEHSAISIGGIGTAAMPIFVRGPSMVNRTPVDRYMLVGSYENATYIIVENIEALVGGVGIVGRYPGTNFTTSYITLRNSESHPVGVSAVVAGTWNENQVHHVVLYNNIVHDTGVWDPLFAVGDRDYMGFSVGHISYAWVLDNEMYHA
jgi:hypothetical protein